MIQGFVTLFVLAVNFNFLSSTKIYKDAFSGDELFSDAYPIEEVGAFYHVIGKESANGIDIVLDHDLVLIPDLSENEYMAYFEEYSEKIAKEIALSSFSGSTRNYRNRNRIYRNRLKSLNNQNNQFLGEHFNDLNFYMGKSEDKNAMILILDYKMFKGEERPYFIVWKQGIKPCPCKRL